MIKTKCILRIKFILYLLVNDTYRKIKKIKTRLLIYKNILTKKFIIIIIYCVNVSNLKEKKCFYFEMNVQIFLTGVYRNHVCIYNSYEPVNSV